MMSQDYKIAAVSPKQKHWQSQYGDFVTYYVRLEGEGDEAVEMNKKLDSPAPEEGQEIHGDITDTQYGRKFKSAKKFPSGASASGGAKSPGAKSPDTEESIARAVALKAGVEFMAASDDPQDVLTAAETFLVWLKSGPETSTAGESSKKDVVVTFNDEEEISLEDIPF